MEEGFESLPPLSVDEATTIVPLEYEDLCGKLSIFEALSKIPKKFRRMRGECLKSESGSYRCFLAYCTQERADLSTLASHMVYGHGQKTDKKLKCFLPSDDGNGVCTVFCKSECDLLTHVKRYFDIRDIVCPSCGEAFVARGDMRNRHKCAKNVPLAALTPALEYNEETQKFLCCIKNCNYSDADKKNLIKHIAAHATEHGTQMGCPIPLCEKLLGFKSVVRHVQQHYPVKDFICTCGKAFLHTYKLYDHQRKVHGTEPMLKKSKKDSIEI